MRTSSDDMTLTEAWTTFLIAVVLLATLFTLFYIGITGGHDDRGATVEQQVNAICASHEGIRQLDLAHGSVVCMDGRARPVK